MLEEFLASGTLNLVYAGVVLISFVFTVIVLVGAEVGDALDFGGDIDLDTDADLGFISISPFAIAMFGASFGTAGLVVRLWLDMEAIPSVLWATGVGLLVGIGAQVFFIYVLSPTKSSHVNLADDAPARQAEVIITIPENGTGQITYDNVNGRVTLGARSTTGEQIDRGKFVDVERVVGRVAFVRPIQEISE